jgi:hypothetical protein
VYLFFIKRGLKSGFEARSVPDPDSGKKYYLSQVSVLLVFHILVKTLFWSCSGKILADTVF